MKTEEFETIIQERSDKDYGLCPPPIPAQDALNVLIKHFLGDDWYVTMPLCTEQVNTEAVHEILRKTQPGILKRLLRK